MDLTELLPEDVLADILRRLAPRWLATSRRVCRAWRATVDRHGLLSAAAGLLPRSVAGILLQYDNTTTKVYDEPFEVRGHCNGLILLQNGVVNCVANPATRQWAHLPPRPPPPCAGPDYFYADDYLVFEPTVSPYYEVFSIPRVRRRREPSPGKEPEEMPPLWEGAEFTYQRLDPALEELEWPPSPCVLHVFSSRTGRWEERSFFRQGAAAGTVADMRIDSFLGHRYGVYWRGSLYVQCQTDFIMRLSLSSGKYQLIQPPAAFEPSDWTPDESYARRLSIGKSEKGVYSVLVDDSQINVWILDDESDGQIKWVSKQTVGHLPRLQQESYYLLESHGPWMLHDINPGFDDGGSESRGQFEWDSDNDNILPDNGNRAGYKYFITFLGFHPYKEVVFLNDSFVRVIAYHLNSSKIQDLGYVYPKEEVHWLGNDIICVERSFPYTPCWMRHYD
ncbi:hypothetical protein C2845_PM01G34570 [Panicum miliaceum]|uniref:F-box domain-containing protein n=1 Tax=Panicum miliaceum TaxID=4540 RepID=A0A3L6TKY6_PANMI|nr:hypothetical protein C2845_PM01G34570 [Panicum miliaceum]